jgi:hypothetical protein
VQAGNNAGLVNPSLARGKIMVANHHRSMSGQDVFTISMAWANRDPPLGHIARSDAGATSPGHRYRRKARLMPLIAVEACREAGPWPPHSTRVSVVRDGQGAPARQSPAKRRAVQRRRAPLLMVRLDCEALESGQFRVCGNTGLETALAPHRHAARTGCRCPSDRQVLRTAPTGFS